MASISKSANLRFLLAGNEINAPIEWEDIELVANFDNDSIQANITTDSFTFVNEARRQILDYIEEGKSGGMGIFEGLPFKIEAASTESTLVVFDGYIDLTQGFFDYPDRCLVECRIVKADGLNSLEERLEAVTFAFLKEKGIITDSDYEEVTYAVISPDQAKDMAIAYIVSYILVKEIAQQIREISRDIATAAGILAAGVTGSIGSAIYTIASILFQIAYTAAIIIALLGAVRTVVNALYPIRRKHKCMSLFTMLRKIFQYAGLGFETTINELRYYHYLPSNPNFDSAGAFAALTVGRITEGIPNSQDYGYLVVELIDLCKKLFKAKYAVVGGAVQFHWDGSPYWIKTADYLPDEVLIDKYRYNTEDFKANRVFAFDTDVVDDWTLKNFTGTNYQVIADAVATNGPASKFTKGLEDVRFPVSLGNRKDRKTILEEIVEAFNNFLRQIKQVFGGNVPISGLSSINGILKVSSNNHSKPKLLYLIDGSIPENHRELLSAKYLYENFHHYDSFVSSNFAGQKVVYDDARVPFGLRDFVKLSENSYFSDGRKAISVNWRLGSDYALISYWERQVYTKNLQEIFIEP